MKIHRWSDSEDRDALLRSRYERRVQGLAFSEIAEQDGVTDGAIQSSVIRYAKHAGLELPIPQTVRASELAAALGKSIDQIQRLRKKGAIPYVGTGSRTRYSVDAVRGALDREAARIEEEKSSVTTKRCYVCKRELPLDAFQTITVRDKRCRPGHSWTGPAKDCRECRIDQRREWRRRSAEEAGRQFVPRGDRDAWEAHMRAEREKRKAERRAKHQRWLAEQQAIRDANRQHKQESPLLACRRCGTTKERRSFWPSELSVCKSCIGDRDAEKFRRDRETLSDSYVKRKLTNYSGLAWSDIPPSLIEAKRAQLMLQRTVSPRKTKEAKR